MKFDKAIPILYSKDVSQSITYFTEQLKFTNKWEWESPPTFGGVHREEGEIFFCKQDQALERDEGLRARRDPALGALRNGHPRRVAHDRHRLVSLCRGGGPANDHPFYLRFIFVFIFYDINNASPGFFFNIIQCKNERQG
jgi:hypothetical protein